MSVLRNIALLTLMSVAANSAAALEVYPMKQGPNGSWVVDTKTFRETTLTQRLWSLQDQRQKYEADLMTAASNAQSIIAGDVGLQVKADELGVPDSSKAREWVMGANSTSLRGVLDAVTEVVRRDTGASWRSIDPAIETPLTNALVARSRIESVDGQINQLKSELAAVKAGR